MKALGITSFGGPSKLEILTLPNPKIEGPEDILVKVHATSINPGDAMRMTGWTRIAETLPLPYTYGHEFSGTILAIGSSITKFKPGDLVYGLSLFVHGSGSTILHLTPLTRHFISHLPLSPTTGAPYPHLPITAAAGLTISASTTLSALQQADSLLTLPTSTILALNAEPPFPYHGGLRGKTVFVPGALGGLGSLAVQVLKPCFGAARVITTVSTAKVGLVEELLGKGLVDQIIDYKTQNVVEVIGKQKVDLLYDTTGASMSYLPVIKKGGLMLSVAGKTRESIRLDMPSIPSILVWIAGWHLNVQRWRAGRYGVRYAHTHACWSDELAALVEKWVGEGKLRVLVGREVDLSKKGAIEEVRALVELTKWGKNGVGKGIIILDGLE